MIPREMEKPGSTTLRSAVWSASCELNEGNVTVEVNDDDEAKFVSGSSCTIGLPTRDFRRSRRQRKILLSH